jgi:hypothetical protein
MESKRHRLEYVPSSLVPLTLRVKRASALAVALTIFSCPLILALWWCFEGKDKVPYREMGLCMLILISVAAIVWSVATVAARRAN